MEIVVEEEHQDEDELKEEGECGLGQRINAHEEDEDYGDENKTKP